MSKSRRSCLRASCVVLALCCACKVGESSQVQHARWGGVPAVGKSRTAQERKAEARSELSLREDLYDFAKLLPASDALLERVWVSPLSILLFKGFEFKHDAGLSPVLAVLNKAELSKGEPPGSGYRPDGNPCDSEGFLAEVALEPDRAVCTALLLEHADMVVVPTHCLGEREIGADAGFLFSPNFVKGVEAKDRVLYEGTVCHQIPTSVGDITVVRLSKGVQDVTPLQVSSLKGTQPFGLSSKQYPLAGFRRVAGARSCGGDIQADELRIRLSYMDGTSGSGILDDAGRLVGMGLKEQTPSQNWYTCTVGGDSCAHEAVCDSVCGLDGSVLLADPKIRPVPEECPRSTWSCSDFHVVSARRLAQAVATCRSSTTL